MRLPWIAAALLLAVPGCAVPYSQTEIGVSASVSSTGPATSVSYFYGALSPYGRWVEYPAYGWCWVPNVSASWRPYSDGRWVYSEYGWTFVSSDPWGWATCHYGRWWFDPVDGWVWVPDEVWGPAWVTWQYGSGWVGWAPLPPDVHWSATIGIQGATVIPVTSWCFVQEDHVFDPRIASRIQPADFNARLLRRTEVVNRFAVQDGAPVNQGVDIDRIERNTGRHADHVHTERRRSPGRPEMTRDGRLEVFRPDLLPARTEDHPPVNPHAQREPSDQERKRRLDERRQRLEKALGAERARLQRQQAEELRAQASADRRREIERKHAEERQKFEEFAAKQRDDFERRAREHRTQRKPGPAEARGPEKHGKKDKDN